MTQNWPDLDPNQKVLLMLTYLDNPKGVDCEEQTFLLHLLLSSLMARPHLAVHILSGHQRERERGARLGIIS